MPPETHFHRDLWPNGSEQHQLLYVYILKREYQVLLHGVDVIAETQGEWFE